MRRLILTLILLAVSVPALAASNAMSWHDVTAETSMTVMHENGSAVPVTSFKSSLTFEPDKFETSHIVLYADITAAFFPSDSLASSDMQQNLAVADSLGVKGAPPGPGTTVITSTAFRKQDNGFVMDAIMALNGRQRSVQIPFTAVVSSYFDVPKLQLEGSFSFMPKDFSSEKLKIPANVQAVTVAFKIAAIPDGVN